MTPCQLHWGEFLGWEKNLPSARPDGDGRVLGSLDAE